MNEVKNRGWQVTLAGLGINLALITKAPAVKEETPFTGVPVPEEN